MVVTASGPPFAVTFPNGGNSINSGEAFTVSWNVGGGNVAPDVNLLISTDGGSSWTPLVSGTPNDGSEAVTFGTPTTLTACRVKVEAVGNIFYDVSNANFTLVGIPTPTVLWLLESEATAEGIVIRWRFADPDRFDRVVVERSDTPEGPWSALPGESIEEPDATLFVDHAVSPGRDYHYRLRAATAEGETIFGPILARALAPRTLGFEAISPSPGRGTIRIDYRIPRDGHVRLRALDLQGRVAATLVDAVQPAGRQRVEWATELVHGRVAPGVYFLRLDSNGEGVVRRVAIAR